MEGLRLKGVLLALATGLVVLAATGCIFVVVEKRSDRSQQKDSHPYAQVYVNGSAKGTAPVTLRIERGKTYRIEFRAAGLKTRTFRLTNDVRDGAITLDALGGVTPVVVDKATGAWYPLNQENVNTILGKQD